MKNSFKKIAKDTNIYLKKYLKNQKKSQNIGIKRVSASDI